MKRHFEDELESLKTTLIKMASVVETNIDLSVKALLEKDNKIAQSVIENDERVDSLELEIDNAIIDLMALRQPVAGDLRFIIAVQKINNDLERIGDHAVNIAQSAIGLAANAELTMLDEIPKMAEIAKSMLKQALDSFILVKPQLAQTVLDSDNQVDDLNRNVTRRIIDVIRNNTQKIESVLELIRVSRNLERVADLATNIAEEVIFYSQARVVKHHAEEKNEAHRETPIQ